VNANLFEPAQFTPQTSPVNLSLFWLMGGGLKHSFTHSESKRSDTWNTWSWALDL